MQRKRSSFRSLQATEVQKKKLIFVEDPVEIRRAITRQAARALHDAPAVVLHSFDRESKIQR
jgi:hypothetical protein